MTAQPGSEGPPSSLVGSGNGPLGACAGEEAQESVHDDEGLALVTGAPEVFMGNSLEYLSDVLGGPEQGGLWLHYWVGGGLLR